MGNKFDFYLKKSNNYTRMKTSKLLFGETKGKNKFFAARQFLVGLNFDEAGGIPGEIHILPKGKWDHPSYGKMEITDSDIALFMKHFEEGLRNDIPITQGHDSDGEDSPAVGWFKKLITRENGLWATVEWTSKGLELLRQKAYKYFSPEFYQVYEDPESREVFDNVLVGGALTNKPYFKELTPVLLSENTIKYFKENKFMDIKELMKKKAAELTPEEKAYMKTCKDKMSEAERETFKAVFDEEGEKPAEEKPADEEKPKEEEAPKEKEKPKEEGGEKVEASEKNMVKISAGELKILQENADKGKQAFAELHKNKINGIAEALVFSEKNSKGKFLPKGKASLVTFMESLTDKQLVAFQEVMKSTPEVKLFGEIGTGDTADASGSAKERVISEIEKEMKGDSKMRFSDALKAVGKKNPALMKEYNAEVEASAK